VFKTYLKKSRRKGMFVVNIKILNSFVIPGKLNSIEDESM